MRHFQIVKPISLRHHCPCTDQQVTETRTRSNTTMAMMRSIICSHQMCFFGFPVDENTIIGYKYIIEMGNGHRLSKFGTKFCGWIARSTSRSGHHCDAGSIDGNGTSYREVFLMLIHSPARHDQQLMHIWATRNDGLNTRNNNSIRTALDDMHITVWLILLRRPF